MSNYTKGPWFIDTETDNKLHKTSIRAQSDVGQMLQICEINNYVDFKTDGANSRLIASAPELLEAAELLLYRLEVCLDDLNQSGEASFNADDEIEKMKKVIAKAKGEL